MPERVTDHVLAPTVILEEAGDRNSGASGGIPLVDAALFAIREIMEDCPEAILYGHILLVG